MPCNSDYMSASGMEKSISIVACLLDELDGITTTKSWWEGYHPRVYNNYTKEKVDKMVAELCSRLQEVEDITKCSLEMQIWWRDHQRADKARIEAELEAQKRQADREALINRLSKYERSLLGV